MAQGTGALFPLCETDYFRRLDLLCAKCGRALRGSYITALGAKYHVEHFTCSLCPTLFGPEDSYYEHDGQVYCHFHYSTLFAIQCTGCHTAILKQFVEINRNNTDEHWHPECYMIHRYWKIKLAPVVPRESTAVTDDSVAMPGALVLSPSSSEESLTETPASLLAKQRAMEHRVFTIWRVLSAFEESSAACISDMLRHLSSGKYLSAVTFAGRFVLHVEVLFGAMDTLELEFQRAAANAISYVREARMLCKKIVNFFSLFSHTQESGARRMRITQELLSLVTGLAHYLKILIRISLTGALRLDQEYGVPEALEIFLARLDKLVSQQGVRTSTPPLPTDASAVHGYASLPRIHTPEAEQASDLCAACGKTVEDECVRIGIALRWHRACVSCYSCGRNAAAVAMIRLSDGRAACTACAAVPGTVTFVHVTRLEQYAFLLCVALNRLDALLQKRQLLTVPPAAQSAAAGTGEATDAESGAYRKSQEMRRLESMYLEGHMSNKAHMPQFSTIVGGPSSYATRPSEPDGTPLHNPWETAPPQPPTAAAAPSVTVDAPVVPVRAPFARHNTDILVREDNASSITPSDPLTHDEGITLADIPMILQAERERERMPHEREHRPVSSLAPEELLVLRYVALAQLQRSAIAEHVDIDDLLETLEVRKSTFWGKFFRGGKERRDVRRKGVFGVSLEWLVERHGADSTLGATPTPMRVPSFVDDVISAMRQMDVSVEGIFRKNGNVRRLKELAEAIDRDAEAVNLLEDNPVQLAALLKKFFRELPDPLLTARLHRLFVQTQQVADSDERQRLLFLVTMLLPRAHRDTMEVLFVFLKWVASFSHVDEETGSRMDLANLATVMCPNILYSRASEPTRGETILSQRVVQHLLEHQDAFWVLPDDLEAILRDRALVAAAPDLPSVELLRRCAALGGTPV